MLLRPWSFKPVTEITGWHYQFFSCNMFLVVYGNNYSYNQLHSRFFSITIWESTQMVVPSSPCIQLTSVVAGAGACVRACVRATSALLPSPWLLLLCTAHIRYCGKLNTHGHTKWHGVASSFLALYQFSNWLREKFTY